MGDVGYMDADLVLVLSNLLKGDGVVVVLGICRVDGEGEGVAHIAAATDLFVGYLV